MSSIEYQHTDGDDYVTELDHRVSSADPAEIYGHLPYRHGRLSVSVTSDASSLDITVEVMNGLSVLRDDPEPSQLGYDGTATVRLVGHTAVDVPITDGSGQSQVDISSITSDDLQVKVESLSDSPVEQDSTIVDLTSGGTTA